MRFQTGILQPGPQGESGIPPSQEETSGLDKSFKLILYTKGLINLCIWFFFLFFFLALSLEPGCLRYKKLLRNLQRLVVECRGQGGGREEWVSRQRDPVQWLTGWCSSREIHSVRSGATVDDQCFRWLGCILSPGKDFQGHTAVLENHISLCPGWDARSAVCVFVGWKTGKVTLSLSSLHPTA